MTIVKYPVLDFKKSLKVFLNYTSEYNTDKPLREQLRPTHAKLFTRMLTLLSQQVYEHNKLFKDTPELREIDTRKPINLRTNRKALSWVENTLKINENTVYRQLNRLIDAKVIVGKINHGSQMNFELLINPEILLIFDLDDPDYEPSSKFLQTKKSVVSKGLNTSFPPEYLTSKKEPFNNLNITVDKESLPNVRDEIVKEQVKNMEKEHGEITQDKSENPIHSKNLITQWNEQQAEKKEQKPAQPRTNLREHQKAAARWFFWYVLSNLFQRRIFNPAHLENTLSYVQQYYFTSCYSLKAIENTKKLYKWRIDKAQRTVERHKTDMQWIFPGHYLDLNKKGNNPNTGKPYMSFANTASWPKKFENFLQIKKKQGKSLSDQDILYGQIKIFLNEPNVNQFRKCEAYVKKNITHLMNDFLGHFTIEKTQANA